jgi:hypothetical protein
MSLRSGRCMTEVPPVITEEGTDRRRTNKGFRALGGKPPKAKE